MQDNPFDIEGFRDYMNETFNLDSFSRDMIDNLISFAIATQTHRKDQLASFLSDLIPEVEFKEAAGFCDDSILTETYGQKQKRDFMEERFNKFQESFQHEIE